MHQDYVETLSMAYLRDLLLIHKHLQSESVTHRESAISFLLYLSRSFDKFADWQLRNDFILCVFDPAVCSPGPDLIDRLECFVSCCLQ